MKVRIWVGRMAILDLLLAGLLIGIRLWNANQFMPTILYQETDITETKKGAQNRPPDKEKQYEGKRIALTFDDGPDPRYTEKLLDEIGRAHV